MAYLVINNVVIRGISAAVPKQIVENKNIYKSEWGG